MVVRSPLLPEREISLRRDAAIKMAHSSTSIEGNKLKEYQVAQLAAGQQINAEERQILEVQNYLKALREVDKLALSKKNFSVRDVLRIHRLVVKDLVEPEKSGTFRSGPVYIVNELPNGKDEVVYTPPRAQEVFGLLKDLLSWLEENRDAHPIFRAGLLHYQFETIHPFTDGNGRTGRLLTLLYLYQAGWDFRKVLVLEDYYNRNRLAYYQALQTAKDYQGRQEADLTNWLEYFVGGFWSEAQIVKDQVLRLSIVGNIKSTRSFLNKDELKIVDFVVTLGKITSADVVSVLSVPKRTAQAKLKKLEEIGVLNKRGAGPATYYVATKNRGSK
jgi:Fic family protein